MKRRDMVGVVWRCTKKRRDEAKRAAKASGHASVQAWLDAIVALHINDDGATIVDVPEVKD